MDANVKRIWVAALRSGKYQQAQAHLRTEDGFCCLGVLCDIYGKDLWRFEDHVDHDEEDDESDPLVRKWKYDATDAYPESTVLPRPVMDWAGLDQPNPIIGLSGNTLAAANDKGASFDELAKIIEEQF
jgi:hypothetical protein